MAVKNCISCGISLECKSNSEILWIKLKSNYFGLKNDIYLAAVYISPLNSSYTSKREDLFDILEKDIAQFSKMGSCIICGDFNSRTNIDSDFVVYDNSKYSKHTVDYIEDVNMFRNNMDKHKVCTYGKRLLDLCKTTNMRILNGNH